MSINGKIYLWFAGMKERGCLDIGCAVSTDGLQTLEVTESPVVPAHFSGTGKDYPLADDFSGVYEDGRILFVYNGGTSNIHPFAGVCEGDPMEPSHYKPLGEIQFDVYPTAEKWYAGKMCLYRGDDGYYMLRGTGVAGYQDIYLYASDDLIHWYFQRTLLEASLPGSWDVALYPNSLVRVGQRWWLSYAGTKEPLWPESGIEVKETFRCGLAISG